MISNRHYCFGFYRFLSWRTYPKYFVLLMLGLLSACGGEQVSVTPPQKWQDAEVRVETRPNPPRAGMNECLVIVTGEHGKPIFDLVVSLRTSDLDPWKQAIQDGQVGVYRRAVEFALDTRTVLEIKVRRNTEESVLRFPLKLSS